MGKSTAIILAAGQGKRMNSKVAKQFMMLSDKPVLCYSIQAFEESNVEDIILVVSPGEEEYVKQMMEPYHFKKIRSIAPGGKERYYSVYEGLRHIKATEYVLIHDGARPCITPMVINHVIDKVQQTKACIVGVPVKDTIKIVDSKGTVIQTPAREQVWAIQTPQAFEYQLILSAYERLIKEEDTSVTDDAMALEKMTGHPVYTMIGDYENIKITTPEDLIIAEQIIKNKKQHA